MAGSASNMGDEPTITLSFSRSHHGLKYHEACSPTSGCGLQYNLLYSKAETDLVNCLLV